MKAGTLTLFVAFSTLVVITEAGSPVAKWSSKRNLSQCMTDMTCSVRHCTTPFMSGVVRLATGKSGMWIVTSMAEYIEWLLKSFGAPLLAIRPADLISSFS